MAGVEEERTGKGGFEKECSGSRRRGGRRKR